jgi:hypothetical protein
MIIKFCATRIYGSKDQYGEIPHTYNGAVNPITIENYPAQGEQLIIHLGAIPEVILQAHTMANARNKILLETMFGGVHYPNIDEAVCEEVARPGNKPDITQFNWYVTFLVTKSFEIDGSLEQQIEVLNEQIQKFDAYSVEHFDLVTTYLTTVMDTSLFSNIFIQDRVFFSTPTKEMLYLPKSTSNAEVAIRRSESAVDGQAIESLIKCVTALPKGRHKWLNTFNHWYVTGIREKDTWKGFQWNFLALEILTNKLASNFYSKIVTSLHFKDRGSNELPFAELFWEQSRMPLKSKFAIVATYLCPETAIGDLQLFSEYKAIRNKISHGVIVLESDIPRSLPEFVTKYLTAAVKKLY